VQSKIQKVSIIGHGNVGHHLTIELVKAGIDVTHISSRSVSSINDISNKINAIACEIEDLPNNQLAIICVPDDTIKQVLGRLNNVIPAAYTSGAVQIEDLPQRESLGVFYPLQTFTKSKPLNMREVPFFIEATSTTFSNELVQLATTISDNVQLATSEERKKLHVAAVMVNNFTNHIFQLAKEFSDNQDISFDHLLPLIKETVNKLDSQSPFDAQTGPARRGDNQTIQDHIDSLEGTTKDIYVLLTNSIQNTYSNND